MLATVALLLLAFDHSAWDRTLKTAVNAIGEVDYARLKNDRPDLDAYVARLKAVSPESHPAQFPRREDQLAYWINAYNALVTYGVAKAYPTKSVRDLGTLFGFFRRKAYTVGGRVISLDDIEHATLRAKFKEPRIHFALVCASLSCPKLARDAYTGDSVNEQLDAQARQYFREKRNLAIDPKTSKITLNHVLGWYREDFGGSLAGALAFARRYASEADQQAIDAIKNPKIVLRDYDWSLNEPGSRARAKSPEERALAH